MFFFIHQNFVIWADGSGILEYFFNNSGNIFEAIWFLWLEFSKKSGSRRLWLRPQLQKGFHLVLLVHGDAFIASWRNQKEFQSHRNSQKNYLWLQKGLHSIFCWSMEIVHSVTRLYFVFETRFFYSCPRRQKHRR